MRKNQSCIKLLEVRDKDVDLCGGRGSFISKCDPEVVLYLAEAVRASSEFIGTFLPQAISGPSIAELEPLGLFCLTSHKKLYPGLLNPYRHYILEDLEG